VLPKLGDIGSSNMLPLNSSVNVDGKYYWPQYIVTLPNTPMLVKIDVAFKAHNCEAPTCVLFLAL